MTRPDPLAEPEGYGSRLGRLEHLTQPAAPAGPLTVAPPHRGAKPAQMGIREPDDICDMTLPGSARCTSPRNWHWVSGCVNEHIAYIDLCDPHEVMSRLSIQMGSPLKCNACAWHTGALTTPSEVIKRARVLPDGSLEWLEDGRIQRPTPVLWDDVPKGG